jgi:hypothetical protein
MAAVFEAIEERWEMKIFKNSGDCLESSYRKGLIVVGLYVLWCLQCCLHFFDLKKIQPLKALNIYSSAKLRLRILYEH